MSTVATTKASSAERIGKAVAEIARRVSGQPYDVVSIQGDTYTQPGGQVRVSIHVPTRADLLKAAEHFHLDYRLEIAGGCTVVGPAPVVGMPDGVGAACVEVYGPSADREALS